ncbi:hypothetical protein P7F88_25450 [Vibrio hannami]|uniref:hypothetical protein n=1 Tax=Vibrio hannami TaxID=2717094 RepID=UPI002410B223|nr:hypothetical protein [Vibrio hannami]MDG3089212.1 hypothetical protein [Vibrio hannami]
MSKRFKTVVRALELPDHLQIRDSRSGGITEAKGIVHPTVLQHAAQHQNGSTTDRYIRDRSASANQVIELRARNAK